VNRGRAILLIAALGVAVTVSVASVNAAGRRQQVSSQVVAAINLACATYGHCAELWRKARCETGGTFDPAARNPTSGAEGLFQFLPSTWQTTPYRMFNVLSPYASALAAGWMHANGRGDEWACR
jgi:SLT domain-containing protein